METKVSEVSWNSLDSLVLGDDPGGFDFLSQNEQETASITPLAPVEEIGKEEEEFEASFENGLGYGGKDGLELDGVEASFGALAVQETLETSFDSNFAGTTVNSVADHGSLTRGDDGSLAKGDSDLPTQGDNGFLSKGDLFPTRGDNGSQALSHEGEGGQAQDAHGYQVPESTGWTQPGQAQNAHGYQVPESTGWTQPGQAQNAQGYRASEYSGWPQGGQAQIAHGYQVPGYQAWSQTGQAQNSQSYQVNKFPGWSQTGQTQNAHGYSVPEYNSHTAQHTHMSQAGQFENAHGYNKVSEYPSQAEQNAHDYQAAKYSSQTLQAQNYQASGFPSQTGAGQNYQASGYSSQTAQEGSGYTSQIGLAQGYQAGYSSQTGQAQQNAHGYQVPEFPSQAGQAQNAQVYQSPEYPGWSYNYQTGQWEQSASYYGSQQYGQGYMNNGTGMQDYQSYSSAQYQYSQPVKYAVTAPRTQDEALRSTAGRPPCTVTAFGFGGRLVVLKPKGVGEAPFQVFQMNQLLDFGLGYGHSSGPLAGNASMKDVLKWLDEKSMKLEESGASNLASLRYMWGVLKICCQHYGNLRSTVNVAAMGRQDDNGPEVALAKLLEPSKSEESWTFGSRCLQAIPTEQQMQATAFEVKRLLIAGKQKEALRAAQEGQLWGCALLMARQLGEKFYSDTIAEMAQRQFQPGFPLRTLTLLYAGQHAGVFVGNANSLNMTPPQPQSVPASAVDVATQDAVEGMLEEWQENLAIMAANRTNGDERVIMHLGDCLWRHRNEIAGAHICYLVADATFESFSLSARLCLIGGDHRMYPRTYASPEAIQRTEVYEFARVTGNSQFILLPFQPYKLIYASMLAEAGKINEALRYCQAVLKTLKTAGNAADVCKEAAIALEERLRIHSQGGPTSIVQRIFGNIGLHKVIGPSPQRVSDNADVTSRPSTASSRSSVNLASSASMEPISDGAKRSMPVRSISEPDFTQSGSPRKGPANKGVFTSFVQRAIGLIRTPAKEAKLGDNNKFRYDETLKRWVEEGAEAQAPVLPLAPPPTTKFSSHLEPRIEENGGPAPISPERPQATPERPQPVMSGMSGIPPMPPSSNQYASRARQNVRSRYVDTFNKATVTPPKPSSDSPPLFGIAPKPIAKPLAPGRFFVPAAAAAAPATTPETSNHPVEFDPSSTAGFPASETLLSNGNGPAFAQPVVQYMKNDPLPTPDLASSSPATFYSDHYPMTPSVVSLPPPPALIPVTQPPVLVASQPQKPPTSPVRSEPVASFDSSSPGVFGDDMQEVEL